MLWVSLFNVALLKAWPIWKVSCQPAPHIHMNNGWGILANVVDYCECCVSVFVHCLWMLYIILERLLWCSTCHVLNVDYCAGGLCCKSFSICDLTIFYAKHRILLNRVHRDVFLLQVNVKGCYEAVIVVLCMLLVKVAGHCKAFFCWAMHATFKGCISLRSCYCPLLCVICECRFVRNNHFHSMYYL